MGLLKNLISGSVDKKEFKEKLRQAQEEAKVQKIIDERSKSSNERELERILEKNRQDQIKKQLDIIRKKETKELWKSNTILKKDKSILRDDRPILKEKNIFEGQKKVPFIKDRSMFFK